eukprot:gene20518-23306_t
MSNLTFSTTSQSEVDVYLAIGSNVGDRSAALNMALNELKAVGSLIKTSFLYETAPMYHTDQRNFLNAACLVRTTSSPMQLLEILQGIERKVGREASFRNGPRMIDVDILLYGEEVIESERLIVPHLRIGERAFVLTPLADIAPSDLVIAPATASSKELTLSEAYEALTKESKAEVRRVFPVYNHLTKQTRIFPVDSPHLKITGVLNVTPDSFSDGGQFSSCVQDAVKQALRMESEGACIIDIGGESTRPGAAIVSTEEELQRVLPVIRALKEAGCKCMISIDTRKSSVAHQAILAGADIVNDVSAGVFDPLMVSTVGSLGVPYIAMHMRGDPLTMTQPQHLNYSTSMATDNNAAESATRSFSSDVISDTASRTAAEQCESTEAKNKDNRIVTIVAHELLQRLNEIDQHIPRWLQWVDPGIGFAKGYEENLALLQPCNLRQFKQLLDGRFLVVGFSRKKFLTRIVEESLAQRRQSGYEIDTDVVSREEREMPDSSAVHVVTVEDRDLASAVGCAAILQGQADMNCFEMDRLINHLQQTLDDDEVAKDALLMLKTVCPNTSTEDPVDSEEPKNTPVSKSDDTISIEENSHIFILQMITSRILSDSVLPVDLPIKVI